MKIMGVEEADSTKSTQETTLHNINEEQKTMELWYLVTTGKL